MEIIDIHTHIYPDQIAQKATDSIRAFYELEGSGNMDGRVETLLARGKEAGISRFVVLPVSNSPARVRSINEFLLGETKKHDCFIGFGTLHAEMEGVAAEAEWILNAGLKGIKMHPDSQKFAIDDKRLFEAYELMEGKLPLLLHMGDPRYDYSHPARLKKLLENFPRMEVIAAHFGGYSMPAVAKELLADTNCVFDISSAMMFMAEGEAEQYINSYGAERMAYGTDYPLWDPVSEVQRFLSLKLTDDQFEQIASKTAKRILKLD